MKLNEVLPEFEKGKSIRRTSWDEEYYLKYDFSYEVAKDPDNHREGFSYADVKADDWEFVQTVEDKQLEKLFEILNDFYNTKGFDARVYKDDLLKILRMK